MVLTQPHTIFMHCLSTHRGEEVTAEVIEQPHRGCLATGRQPLANRAGGYLLTGNGGVGSDELMSE